MSSQKLRDLLSTATHAVNQAEAEAYKGIGFNRDGDFPALRDEIEQATTIRNRLLDGVRHERNELQREVDMLKVRLDGMLSYNERDDLRRDRDEFHRQLDTARMELSDERKGKRGAFRRVVTERDELQRERDTVLREVMHLRSQDARQQLEFCRQHRDGLQEQLGSAEGHRDALLHDMDMLEAQVCSRNSAIAELTAVDAEFADTLREASRSLAAIADEVE